MTNGACNLCRFWAGTKANDVARCHRYPPVAAGNAMLQVAGTIANPKGGVAPVPIFTLPETAGDHWCGEFAPAVVS